MHGEIHTYIRLLWIRISQTMHFLCKSTQWSSINDVTQFSDNSWLPSPHCHAFYCQSLGNIVTKSLTPSPLVIYGRPLSQLISCQVPATGMCTYVAVQSNVANGSYPSTSPSTKKSNPHTLNSWWRRRRVGILLRPFRDSTPTSRTVDSFTQSLRRCVHTAITTVYLFVQF